MARLAAVLLVLVLPATAGAYTLPVGGVTVGGGGFSTAKLLDRGLSIKVGSDGRTLRLSGLVGSRCGDKAILRTFAGQATLDDTGSFSVTLATRAPVDTYYFRGSGKAVIEGTFDGESASGTIALTGARVQLGKGKRIACNDDAGTFEARDPSGATGTGTPTAPSALFGLTAQKHDGVRQPVLAFLSAKKRLTISTPLYLSHCRYAYNQLFNDTPAMKVSSKGAFSNTDRFATHYSNSTVRYKMKTSGRFTARHGIAGKFELDVRVVYKRTGTVRCADAVKTRFTALP